MRYAIALVFCLFASQLAAEKTWEPEKTWVFAVGVLEYDAAKLYGSFPKEGRRDQVFMDTLETRGVPKANIVFIKDGDATKAKIAAEFEAHVKKAAAGDTLIVYYAGHGIKDKDRNVYFVPNDAKGGAKEGYTSCWSVSSAFDDIEKHFKGSSVMVFTDCCHCGGVCTEAGKRQSKIAYATMVSAHLNTISTPRWTFTNVLIDTFGASPLVDTDGNEKVTFAEAAYYAETEMAFFEQQLSVSGVCNGFDRYTVLSKPAKRTTKRLAECLEGEWDKKWYKCKIIDYKKEGDVEEFKVTWVGYKAEDDAWMPASRLRKWKPETHPGGTECEVEAEGKWWKAKIKEHKLGLHLVHYEGYPDEDDEWVALKRIKVTK
ncbi:MAG: caspase family protein [Planctomycetes bacterium]|nr:caspase family protein [Planctomycetota bacterium]